MAYVVPSSVTNGQLITHTKWNQDVVDNVSYLYGVQGIWDAKVAYSLLGSAGTFSFTSLASSYDDLIVVMHLRTDYTATTTDAVRIRFNNDATAVYQYQHIKAVNATVTGGAAVGQTSLFAASVNVMDSQAGNLTVSFSPLVMVIPMYANTSYTKVANIYSGISGGAAAGDQAIIQGTGLWNSTAAISRIDIAPINGTNFNIGSKVAIYAGQSV